MGLIIGGAAAALAAGAGAYFSSESQKKGAKSAQKYLLDALAKLKAIDIGQTVNLADARDIARFKTQFEVQKQHDPLLAQARETGVKKLIEGLSDPQADAVLRAMQTDALKDNPQREQIIDQLFDDAQKELAAGATLPPEFQQELVRAGLESTSGAGVGGDYRGAAGAPQRQLLGQAGLNLKAFRLQQAGQATTMADALKQHRQAILTNAAATGENIAGQRQVRALNAFEAGQSSVPAIGLSGHDVANLSEQNTAFENWRLWQAGNVKAGTAKTLGDLTGQQYKTIGDTASSVISGVTTGVAGMPGKTPTTSTVPKYLSPTGVPYAPQNDWMYFTPGGSDSPYYNRPR
jgi:hypothetical protein